MHNPFVPETLEGWSVLHLMYRVRWDRLRGRAAAERDRLAADAARALAVPDAGATAMVQILGHKADLMFVCFRRRFDELARAQLALSQTELHEALEATTSYVSVVELGMYEMTAKIHEQLGTKHTPGSDEFDRAFDAEMETQRQRVMGRLFLELPKGRYVCFYPMNKRRGEQQNWYSETFERRAAMMREHGMIGRHYAGRVTQVISGSIGFDDWEWGVDLFADDPLVFKKLIYEMRFDEASAKFAEFGPFYTGLQFAPGQLAVFLNGGVPGLT
ncbi:MAG: heme-dependent peroxidase [Acidobacteria bacterium RIFCSPLOWO2_12_FULL_67_14]|nr:MAG: heme-dependent peroxidase [Acidobacteria bacterium RIFCSPLOWO2_02_FULL_67_21]OFW41105.1 MAG: heme-dependent peroxidase [Acidobacteria bacterium RIFCSPLOWO2_12_FULL_67_14]